RSGLVPLIPPGCGFAESAGGFRLPQHRQQTPQHQHAGAISEQQVAAAPASDRPSLNVGKKPNRCRRSSWFLAGDTKPEITEIQNSLIRRVLLLLGCAPCCCLLRLMQVAQQHGRGAGGLQLDSKNQTKRSPRCAVAQTGSVRPVAAAAALAAADFSCSFSMPGWQRRHRNSPALSACRRSSSAGVALRLETLPAQKQFKVGSRSVCDRGCPLVSKSGWLDGTVGCAKRHKAGCKCMQQSRQTALLAILVAGIGPIVFVGGFHVGLVDEDPNPALEWLSIDPRARNLQQSENQPQQQGPAINKRFLFHSNGDCYVFVSSASPTGTAPGGTTA
uniref:BRICHOS domain-containing protein n=1 Tax=Macrostomum lignano TaxID=282301 RepID=A0A1I8FF97_9PLAT